MKKRGKFILYLSIPVVFVIAVVIYKTTYSGVKTGNGSGNQGNSEFKAKNRGEGEKSLPVSVHIADLHLIEDGLTLPGTLVARERVEMASELAGRVVSINFKEGEFVKKGEILVKLNDDELQAQLLRAQYQYDLLSQKLERQKILLSKEAVSREEYDQVSTEFNVLKQDIEQLEIKIEKMKIRAPFDGVIGFRNISLGALLVQGSKVATIVDVAHLILEFSIPEKYVRNQLIGKSVTFTIEGMGNTFSALIYAIDPEVDVQTHTMTLRAKFDNSRGLLKPGMYAKVSVISQKDTPGVYVPNQAIVSGVKGHSVWMIKDRKASLIKIQTGLRTVDMMEVVSGVEKGDTVIITGLMQLREGMSVTPTNLKSE